MVWIGPLSEMDRHPCSREGIPCGECEAVLPQGLVAEHKEHFCALRRMARGGGGSGGFDGAVHFWEADEETGHRSSSEGLAAARQLMRLGDRRAALCIYSEVARREGDGTAAKAEAMAAAMASVALASFYLEGYDVVRVDPERAASYARAAEEHRAPGSRYLHARAAELSGHPRADALYEEGWRTWGCLLCETRIFLRNRGRTRTTGRVRAARRRILAEFLEAAYPPGCEVHDEAQILLIRLGAAAAGEASASLVQARSCSAIRLRIVRQEAGAGAGAGAGAEADRRELEEWGIRMGHPWFLHRQPPSGPAVTTPATTTGADASSVAADESHAARGMGACCVVC